MLYWTGNVKRWFPRKHDVILFYVKNESKSVFNPDNIRVPYKAGAIIGGKTSLSVGEGVTVEQREARMQELVDKGGKMVEDWWADIGSGGHIPKGERTGYPTQKPIALYKRIIEASSNPGDIVLDPFCGCATTLVAAQQLDRRWLGIDLWPTALQLVEERLDKECPLFTDTVYSISKPVARTDDGEYAAPPLKSKVKQREPIPEGEDLSRDEMVKRLLLEQNHKCAGCNRKYDDPRIWELDHKMPRSDGGHNGISNRALLCPPCNRLKSNSLTMSGLVKENKKRGYLV